MKKFSLFCSTILAVFLFIQSVYAQEPGKEFFAGRRTELGKRLENSALIIASGISSPARNSDAPFKQEDNFYYLTGYKNPDVIALFSNLESKKYVIFIKKRVFRTMPGGPARDMLKEAIAETGADTAYYTEDLEKVITRLMPNFKSIYTRRADREVFDIVGKVNSAASSKLNIVDPTQLLAEMRMIKTPEEISYLKKAANITTLAHIEAMKAAKPGLNERIIEAVIDFVYKTNWASGIGFPSILGSGPNSLVLHYQDNDQEMKEGTVMVMDIGAAYNGYSADITRTIPINGKFTNEQKDIYNAVLRTQKTAAKVFGPGTLPRTIEDTVATLLRAELYKLGLVTDPNTKWQHRIWYTHGCSHSIGLDVHDLTPSSYQRTGMKPNMVFTLEPGLYISEASLDGNRMFRYPNVSEKEFNEFIEKVRPIARKYNNIGIRIEDDILITEKGSEIISAACPKEIAEIEKVMAQKSRFVD